eukprot:scaffold565_cov379-Pinguiococcus_pyrenoidosus.AAC.17
MRARAIAHDVHARKAHVDMRRRRRPQLFADLRSDAKVAQLHRSEAKRTHSLRASVRKPADAPQRLRQHELLQRAIGGPRGEVAALSVVAVVRQRHLGSDEEDLFVQHENAAIVQRSTVSDLCGVSGVPRKSRTRWPRDAPEGPHPPAFLPQRPPEGVWRGSRASAAQCPPPESGLRSRSRTAPAPGPTCTARLRLSRGDTTAESAGSCPRSPAPID